MYVHSHDNLNFPHNFGFFCHFCSWSNYHYYLNRPNSSYNWLIDYVCLLPQSQPAVVSSIHSLMSLVQQAYSTAKVCDGEVIHFNTQRNTLSFLKMHNMTPNTSLCCRERERERQSVHQLKVLCWVVHWWPLISLPTLLFDLCSFTWWSPCIFILSQMRVSTSEHQSTHKP